MTLPLAIQAQRKVEVAPKFTPAQPDPQLGDWSGDGGFVAQVFQSADGKIHANLLTAFDAPSNLVAALQGTRSGDTVTFSGEGASGVIEQDHFTGGKDGVNFNLHHVVRASPTLGAKPPPGAVVLYDGHNLDAWAKKKGKQWLVEDGPAPWKILPDGAMEVIPGSDCMITHQKFGDCHLHVEFRTIGFPSKSAVFLETRYEVNINETYGRTSGNMTGGMDNTTAGAAPRVRAALPPLAWQTFDIDFRAPRFNADGNKTEEPRMTVLLNGVQLYHDQPLDPPHGAAGRLGEAATGPLMLQDHLTPLQYRNIWLVEPGAGAKAFHHPGVLINKAQLDFIKAKVAEGAEPWKSAYEAAKASQWGALNYEPHAWATCECGPHSNPNLGCKDEQRDSEAAYTQALLWSISGDQAYAANAIKIMNAWSGKLVGGHLRENGPVQAAWCAEEWPRAAEIIRYSDAGWAPEDVEKFKNMLTTQYVSSLAGGSCENGNKELSMSEALINIGVFNDDRAIFEAGLKMWRGRAPAAIYLKTDGPEPVKPANCPMAIWGNKGLTTPLVDGLLQETVRDSQHANLALSAMVNAAETARQQGVDLYSEQAKRIMAALEFQAAYLPPNNAPPPENTTFHLHPTWEIAYNHYHNRLGFDLPKMGAVIAANRPTGVNHQMAWETLTHAGVGAVGLPPVETP